MKKTHRLVFCALLSTFAVALSYVESLFPLPLPGARLGLGNAMVLLTLITMGGGAAALVALNDILASDHTPNLVVLITAGLGVMIGSVTFTGSLIAAGKLQGNAFVKKMRLTA